MINSSHIPFPLSRKMRILQARNLSPRMIGCSGLLGLPLVDIEDEVGFMMYDVTLDADIEMTLQTGFPECHHVYYIVAGTAEISIKGESVDVHSDMVVAIRDDITATCTISTEKLHMVVIYAIKKDGLNPKEYTKRVLSDILAAGSDLDTGIGKNRSMLTPGDQYNISLHDMIFLPNSQTNMHHLRHRQAACYLNGSGQLEWNDGNCRNDFACTVNDAETWTTVLFDDTPCRVTFRTGTTRALCVFSPPLSIHSSCDWSNPVL